MPAALHGWFESWPDALTPVCFFDADDIAETLFAGNGQRNALDDHVSLFLCTIAKRVMVDLFRRNALEKAYLEMLALMPEGSALREERESQLETLQLSTTLPDGLNGKNT